MDEYAQPDAPEEVSREKRSRSGSRPTKEQKRLQMQRYRARHPHSLRIYWKERKRLYRQHQRMMAQIERTGVDNWEPPV